MVSFGFIGRDDVAALLEITPGRVSQLQTEDSRFPQPSFSIGKTRAWRKDAVVAYQRGRKGRSTLTLQALQSPTSPLPRVLDEVVTLALDPPYRRGMREIYIRVWSGSVTVALIEGIDDPAGAGLSNRIESFASQLIRLFPRLLTGEVCWIQSNRSTSSAVPKVELANVVFEIAPDDTVSNPHWVYLEGFEPLATILGDPKVEMYPAGTLTKTNIRLFQRSGGPIEVVANEDRIRDRMEMIRAVETSPLPDRDKETALDYLATGLELLDDTATTPLNMKFQYEEHRRSDSGTFVPHWAVKRIERPLTMEERSIVKTRSLPYDGNGQPFDSDRLMELLRALQQWGEDIDEYADHPDPDLYGQVRDLARALPTFITDDELRRQAGLLLEEITGPFIAHFNKSQPHVRQYLAEAGEMVPLSRQQQQREQRVLSRQVSHSAADDDAYFGYDRFGNHLAQSLEDYSRGDAGFIVVLWPRESSPVSIADHILIAGSHDTLAFIANPDRSLRALLPRVDTAYSVGWATGYGGSGPGDLIDAVCNVLTSSGLRPNIQPIRQAIIPETTPETVWLKVEDIIER